MALYGPKVQLVHNHFWPPSLKLKFYLLQRRYQLCGDLFHFLEDVNFTGGGEHYKEQKFLEKKADNTLVDISSADAT